MDKLDIGRDIDARRASDYAMALDLLGKIAHSDSEDEAAGSIFDVFSMLFAPKTVSYLSFNDGESGGIFYSTVPEGEQEAARNRLEGLEKNYALTSSKEGFLVKIGRENRPVAVLEIDGLSFPQYLDYYLNLALSLVGVCGLAIENARRFEKIAEQKNRLLRTLEELKNTQARLVETEKMASLGNLVAGVAHEINTPVGVGITASSALLERNAKLDFLYKQKKMTRADLEDYIRFSEQTAKLVFDNLKRTGELVKSFKKVSVDQTAEWKRKFFLKSYLTDVARSVWPKMKDKKIRIDIDCDDDLEIESYPGFFAQIATNLLLNSVVHGFDNQDPGKIEVFAKIQGDDLVISYVDDGRGIPKKDLPKIFDPFFTADKRKGSGLGLHIVYNIVVNKLGGSIECESEPGKGVSFSLRFPLQENKETEVRKKNVGEEYGKG